MDEKETKEDQPEDTTEPEDEGLQSAADAKIEELNAASERKEKANARAEEILRVKEVGGGSEAGQIPKAETEDEKWEKDAKKRYEGTGMDPTPDDSPTVFT